MSVRGRTLKAYDGVGMLFERLRLNWKIRRLSDYLLDREMSDAEMSFRNEADYVSKYRRVLEHFDAVKIGLTATPALHTVQIFGDPRLRI
jgi:hypothetical protein